MFRPRHAYKSPITNRYRGKAKGCPVFNNLIDINSAMVEQHDECLECLAKIKNRTDLYRTLAENNKPNNNVIKSLQRLSSSASNNRLKTCLQFLIIKVNEKSITTPHATTTTTTATTTTIPETDCGDESPKSLEQSKDNCRHIDHVTPSDIKNHIKKQRFNNYKQRLSHKSQKEKHDQLASPPQDQVSSTQDQVGPSQDDHDCQTSPMMLVTTQTDDIQVDIIDIRKKPDEVSSITKQEDHSNTSNQIQSSLSINYASTTTSSSTTSTASTTTSTSPTQTETIESATIHSYTIGRNNSISQSRDVSVERKASEEIVAKRRRIHNSSDHDSSSITSWSSYNSPPSPLSTSSTSSISSSSSRTSSSCSSSSSISPSISTPSPISSPEIVNELRGPRLKLSEDKIRKIKKRPIQFDDYYIENSFASTPTTSSGCSPGQHSNFTQNSDQSRSSTLMSNTSTHTFQAPPRFVNNLKPCNLPTEHQEAAPASTPPAPTKEMLNCAICGIKDRPPNINKIYGQNSCLLCTRFFATFLKMPQQLYCAQDGDCLMTFDSRCQACWIKICLQKFDIDEEHRKTGQKYSPKLLSCPNVSLITIDTSPR